MTPSKPSRSSIFLVSVAAACVAGAVALRSLRPIAANVNDPALTTLNSQMVELAPYTTLALSRAREARAAAEERLWTSEKLAAWLTTVPPSWRVQEVAPVPAVFTTQRRFLMNNPAAAFRDWPDIVAFITAVAEQPACRIHSLSITAPAGSKRSFTQLNMLVGFASAKPDQKPNPPAQ